MIPYIIITIASLLLVFLVASRIFKKKNPKMHSPKAAKAAKKAKAKAAKKAQKAKAKASKKAKLAKEKAKAKAEKMAKIQTLLNPKDIIEITYTNYKADVKEFKIYRSSIVDKGSFINVHVMPTNQRITLRKTNIKDYATVLKKLPKSILQTMEPKLKGDITFDLIYNNFLNVTSTIPVDVATIRNKGSFISVKTLRSRKRLAFKIHKIQNLDGLKPLVEKINTTKHMDSKQKQELHQYIEDCIIKQQP